MLRSRFSAAFYLALVFASGALVGGFATRLYLTSRPVAAAPRTSPEEYRRRYVDEMKARVNLDDQQVQRLQQILDGTRQRYHAQREQDKAEAQAIHARQTEQIRAMLRDDQRPLYEQLRAERERRRQEYDRRKGPPRR